MRTIKILFIIFLATSIWISTSATINGAKRAKRKPMETFTNPNSPSYVPIPFPKNRKEIIKDLEYYVEEDVKDGNTIMVGGRKSIVDTILLELVSEDSPYSVGEILKIKNRLRGHSEDYIWLIYIENSKGIVELTVAMCADGNIAGLSAVTEKAFRKASPAGKKHWKNFRRVIKKKHVMVYLSKALARTVSPSEIKRIEPIIMPSRFSDLKRPLWVITMKNGTIYYYSINLNGIFKMVKRHPWNNYTATPAERAEMVRIMETPNSFFINDQLADHMIEVKKVADAE